MIGWSSEEADTAFYEIESVGTSSGVDIQAFEHWWMSGSSAQQQVVGVVGLVGVDGVGIQAFKH